MEREDKNGKNSTLVSTLMLLTETDMQQLAQLGPRGISRNHEQICRTGAQTLQIQ